MSAGAKARALMVLGTGSHVGKSLLTAALCRIFAEQGYRVAPFKSQNMSLNSAVTPEGLEIGRAQALQAEAAGILPSVHMNPILLKPMGNMTSQVVVLGKIWGKLSAAEYHLRRVDELLPVTRASYEVLAAQNDVVILEGAGSPAEINLKQHDIVNMRMAEMADAACLLVGDIDRGGVFASLLGTVELLEPEEQDRIAGFVINKFRGDVGLLGPGVRMMEERLGKPCFGVMPFLEQLEIDEEDSLGLHDGGVEWLGSDDTSRALRIAVIALPSFSNFTDFDALRAEASVSVRFCRTVEELRYADVVVIPGSKQTAEDLGWMRRQGLAGRLIEHAGENLVVGICGGMQMLGREIADPYSMEHDHMMEHDRTSQGLGLLAIRTTMQPQKVTRVSVGELVAESLFGQRVGSLEICGYEIHVGDTDYLDGAKPFARLATDLGGTGFLDGCVAASGRVFGTYLHGLFDDDRFRHAFVTAARTFYGLTPAGDLTNWKRQREASFDRLTDAVRGSLDMEKVFGLAGLKYDPGAQG